MSSLIIFIIGVILCGVMAVSAFRLNFPFFGFCLTVDFWYGILLAIFCFGWYSFIYWLLYIIAAVVGLLYGGS